MGGFDELFQTNYLGHFLLVKLLLKHLKEGAPSRVFQVTSVMHRSSPKPDWTACRKRREPFRGLYGTSKLAQILFARELHERLSVSGVASHAYNPGGVCSDIWRNSSRLMKLASSAIMQSPELQCGPSLYLNGYRGA